MRKMTKEEQDLREARNLAREQLVDIGCEWGQRVDRTGQCHTGWFAPNDGPFLAPDAVQAMAAWSEWSKTQKIQ